MEKTMEDLFNEFQVQGLNVSRRLASIVQNEGIEVSYEQLTEWVAEVNNTINGIETLKKDVVRHFSK